MITGGKQNLTSVLLGAVAGLLVINAYGLFFKPEPVSNKTISAESLTPRQKLELMENRMALAKRADPKFEQSSTAKELEARIKELEELQAKQSGKAHPDSDTRPIESADEAKEHAEQVWRGQLAAHDAEPVNAKWSAAVTPGFQADFAKFSSDVGFAVGATDCRSTSCTVEVEWPTFGEAATSYDQVVNQPFTNNCAVHIILPEPSKGAGDQPYKGKYLFRDCEPSATVAALDHSAR